MSRQDLNLTDSFGAMFSALKNNEDDIYEKLAMLIECMQDVEVVKGRRGRFLRIGTMCYYVLNEFLVEYLDAESYYTIDSIPDGFTPALSLNHIAITSNAQLSESLVLQADRTSGTMKIVNMASSPVSHIKLLNSSYEYVISKDIFDNPEIFDPNELQWEEIPTEFEQGFTNSPYPTWRDLDDEGWG